MLILLAVFLLGIVSGLRTFLAPAAVSWAARSGAIQLAATPLAFLDFKYTPYILTVLAIGELIGDKLPSTPSRKDIVPFICRMMSGALVGAATGVAYNLLWAGLTAGLFGAVAGTLGGAYARSRLAAAFSRDLPAALIEDAFAILLAILAVTRI